MPRHFFLVVTALALGCGPGGGGPTGDVLVFLEAESTITDGLTPGLETENVVDGWTVSYSQFIVALGELRIGRSSTSEEVHDGAVRIIDLASWTSK